jgi:hypothetical protein
MYAHKQRGAPPAGAAIGARSGPQALTAS